MPPDDQKLLSVHQQLGPEAQATLLAFAEFLLERQGPLQPVDRTIQNIPRPEQESVVAAMRRLASTYPMLERKQMVGADSTLMTQHIMKGRPANEVIDELEVVFRSKYEESFGPVDETPDPDS